MREALRLAREGEAAGEVPVGAVIAIGDDDRGPRMERARSRGTIRPRTPRSWRSAKPRRRRRNYRLEGATLYCTLEPCVMCAGAMVNARIARLVFGARDLRFGGVRSKFRIADSDVLNHRVEIVEGVLAVECVEVLREFFAGTSGTKPRRALVEIEAQRELQDAAAGIVRVRKIAVGAGGLAECRCRSPDCRVMLLPGRE